jgi:hypothetical protein
LTAAKAASTVTPDLARPMQSLARAWGRRRGQAEMLLVYRPPSGRAASRAFAPGVQALGWREFVAELCSD